MGDDRTQLGIDLGTTNSVVALGTIPDDGDPDVQVIENTSGNLVTPSLVYYEEDGSVRVGRAAEGMEAARPNQVVREIKREMDEPDYTIEIHGEEYTPVDVSAEILKEMRSVADSADAADPDEVDKIVVTVPAYFKERAKKRTLEAAEQAGLDVSFLTPEPEAAARVYDETGELIVYDFGGGTLDIAVVEVTETDDGRKYQTKDIDGDMELGGRDFDEALTEHIIEDYKEVNGVDIRDNDRTYSELRGHVERAKKELSDEEETSIVAPALGTLNGEIIGINRDITREEFEEVIDDLLDRAREPLETVIDRQDMEPGDPDDVLLVGGSTRMPAVQELVEEVTGVDPTMDVAPARVVARGASIADRGEGPPPLPRSIGVKVKLGGDIVVDYLLEKGTPLSECEASKKYTTTEDDQTSVSIEIFEAEDGADGGPPTDPDAEEVELLGDGVLDKIEPAPAGDPEIEVSFSIDPSSGTLKATADDLKDPDNDVTIEIDRGM